MNSLLALKMAFSGQAGRVGRNPAEAYITVFIKLIHSRKLLPFLRKTKNV